MYKFPAHNDRSADFKLKEHDRKIRSTIVVFGSECVTASHFLKLHTFKFFCFFRFCSIVINDGEEHKHQGSTFHLTPNELPPGSPDSITSNPSTEVLLELAEECPLSPSLLLTASPMDVNPVVGTPELHKGEGRKRESLSDSKKRRLKKCNSNAKRSVTAALPTPNTSPKALSAAPEEG
jgi:hypothetical protein